MRNLELNLGMACNNKCLFCMSGNSRVSEKRWLPLDRAKREVLDFFGKGCRSLGFLGGEPTMYPRLADLVRYAKALGYERIELCSNGTRFSDPAYVDSLIEAGVTRFGVSIHSHEAAMEDALTGLRGNFGRKLKGLRHLRRLRFQGKVPHNVSLNPVLNKRTLPAVEAFIGFFRREGFDDIRFNYIWPQARVEHDKAMIPSYREAMPQLLRVMLLNEDRWRMHLTFGGIPCCMLALGGRRLSKPLFESLAGKYLSECDDLPTEVSLRGEDRFSWQERKREMLKTHAEGCAKCRFFASCDGVWKSYAALYGTGEMRPA